MQLNTLPASAADIGGASSFGGRVFNLPQVFIAKIREWVRLRRQLDEIQALSNRELLDIGLGHGDIQRLRQGDVFLPLGWAAQDGLRD